MDAPAVSTSMSVLVIGLGDDGAHGTPLADAKLAVDLPGGEHRDIGVGPDGRAVISDIDWFQGTASVVAYGVAGRGAYGVVDVSPSNFARLPKPPGADGADVVLYLAPLLPPNGVTVSGLAANALATTDAMLVSGAPCASVYEGPYSYDVVCAHDTAFTLVARDEQFTNASGHVTVKPQRWFKADIPALPKDGVLQVDFDFATATPLNTSTANVHIAFGDLKTAVPGVGANLYVTSVESKLAMFLGAFVESKPMPSGVDFGVEWVDVPGQTPLTATIVRGNDGSASGKFRAGVPKDGDSYADFLPLPTLTGPLTLKKAIDVAGAPPTATVRLQVAAPGYGLRLDAPPGTTTLHVPRLPAGAKPATGVETSGNVYVLDALDAPTFQYRAFARTAFTVVTLP